MNPPRLVREDRASEVKGKDIEEGSFGKVEG